MEIKDVEAAPKAYLSFGHKYKVNPIIKFVCLYPVTVIFSGVGVKYIRMFEELDGCFFQVKAMKGESAMNVKI